MANFWFKFEWDVWREDKQLRRCSKETRGFWIDLIAELEDRAAAGEREAYFLEGTPEELCRILICSEGEFERSVAELKRTGAANVEKSQGLVKILSRRLLKKHNLTEYNRLKKEESRLKHTVNDVSNECQDTPSKIQSLRALDNSTNPKGFVSFADDALQNKSEDDKGTAKREKPEPKTMLPSDFQITEEMRDWAKEHAPSVDIDLELDEFKTYWREIATRNHRRTIRGWNATWKTRIRERQEKLVALRGTNRNGTSNQTYQDKRELRAVEDHNTFSRFRENAAARRNGKLPGSSGSDS